MDTWSVIGLAVLSGIVLLYVFIIRWAFRVNEQILLLKQIWEQLRNLNGKKSS